MEKSDVTSEQGPLLHQRLYSVLNFLTWPMESENKPNKNQLDEIKDLLGKLERQ
jgi:hypothetical protein